MANPSFLHLYRRPARVSVDRNPRRYDMDSSSEGEKEHSSRTSSAERTLPSSKGIPASLSFDNIIKGGTCPPCTVRDFMDYLQYIELSAENLQFFLWIRDYTERFAKVNPSETNLSPEWTREQQDRAIAVAKSTHAAEKSKIAVLNNIFKDTTFDGSRPYVRAAVAPTTFEAQSPRPYSSETESESHSSVSPLMHPVTEYGSSEYSRTHAADPFKSAGLPQPFTIQPFRAEIKYIVNTYVLDGAPRQLNISSKDRTALIAALAATTHPSAFDTIKGSVERDLRRQSHPNFIRWVLCNGNPARVFFARGLGIFLIAAGIILAALLTASKASRGYRAIAAFPWLMGIATLICAYKGMCVVLHGLHHSHIRPWELFDVATDEEKQTLHPASAGSQTTVNTLASSSNSFETAPWVKRYESRNVIRKIFDRERRIQEPALKNLQDIIFWQSILMAALCTGVLLAIFLPIPAGNHF